MKTKEKLRALRAHMKQSGLHAYLVPSSDAHNSEYIPECWQRRAYISGFTGSAGEVLVTSSNAALWTDSRYFLQAERELAGSGIKLQKIGIAGTPDPIGWLKSQLPKGGKVGVNPQLVSKQRCDALRAELADVGLQLVLVTRDLVDAVWPNRPALPTTPLEVHELKYSGESVISKLKRVRTEMKRRGAVAHVLNELDAIAWLFNLRGRDVEYNPVFIAYAIVRESSVHLYLDLRKVTPAVRKHLGKHVTLHRYEAFGDALKGLAKSRGKVWLHDATATQWMFSQVGKAQLITERSPITLLKAMKTAHQIKGMQAAHVRDGVAMVKFLAWVDANIGKVPMSELSLEVELERARTASALYRGPSFSPIIGYGPNGAVVHYRAVQATSKQVKARSIMVVDSGGQYPDGTTDITRVVPCGPPSRAQKEHFTRVLKGHIGIVTTPFPKGTRGPQLEVLARRSLWMAGLNYLHGTGHGIGHYLCVHEGPASLAPRFPNEILQPGMVLSNEPGYYKDGEYGIRIENLVYVAEDKVRPGFLKFENLTLCPIDTRLIEVKYLTEAERKYLNDYHARVRKTLGSKLRGPAKAWLLKMTRAI
ncbi:MAG: aminopeptidase P family protein [bacterium]|nr:aminopeptidase P family protein [bacterium]